MLHCIIIKVQAAPTSTINENDPPFDNKVSRQSEYLAASSVWDNTCSDINSLLLQCTF